MDTKWKKCKKITGFTAFAAGWTLVIVNLIPAVAIFAVDGAKSFEAEADYQTYSEFRKAVGGRLMSLISVAAKGEPAQAQDTVVEESTTGMMAQDYGMTAQEYEEYQAYLEEQQAHYEEMAADGAYGAAEYSEDYELDLDAYNAEYYDYYFGDGFDEEKRDAYMAELAHNKNLLYAVAGQGKLLYTNVEALAPYVQKTDENWQNLDFQTILSPEEYNFTLWFNWDGDGKVQITKDGVEQDVYGNGVYTDNSDWRVPGYTNFTLGDAAGDVVVFLAAAKSPGLYMVGDNAGGVNTYGSRFYSIQQDAFYRRAAFRWACLLLSLGAAFLVLAFLLRRDGRLAAEQLAGFLGKLCLELKMLLLLAALTCLAGMGGMLLGQLVWWIRCGFAYYIWSGDTLYELAKFRAAGGYLAAFFWLFYLAALDFRKNRGKQKKPLFDLLKKKDLRYPIQKRLVRGERRTLLAELVVIVLFAFSLCVIFLIVGEYMNSLTGGYAYEFVEEYAGRSIGNAFLALAEATFGALFVFTMITFCSLRKKRRLATEIGALTDQILAVREGSLTKALILPEDSELKEAAENLNGIQKGMETAVAQRVKSERMKVELVTNVSHDIKTPLTSIISYVELLRQEQDLPVHVKEYIQILGEKSERLRSMVQDVFEVSKAASGQLPIKPEILDMGKLLRQTLADMDGQISESALTMKVSVPQEQALVRADGQRLYRVFQNLLQNALRYSLEGSRVYLTLTREAGEIVVRIKNTSGTELPDDKDFTERFVRGDESRTDGGSGLGLSIAKSFTQACGGSFSVETDADLFTATVRFPEEKQES